MRHTVVCLSAAVGDLVAILAAVSSGRVYLLAFFAEPLVCD